MPSLEMEGPHKLDLNTISTVVEKDSLGNYALGYVFEDKTSLEKLFRVTYVGRGIVYDRLYAHLTDEYKQPLFKFSYAKNEPAACNKECKNYHDFGAEKLANKEHPKLPKDTKCLYCRHVGT